MEVGKKELEDVMVFYHNKKKVSIKGGNIYSLCEDEREDRCCCKKCYRIEFTRQEYEKLLREARKNCFSR